MTSTAVSLWSTAFVQEHFKRACQAREATERFTYESLASCLDSPLELAFTIWWDLCAYQYGEATLRPQVPVTIGDDAFRLDFIATAVKTPTVVSPLTCVAIELDGHDFHERTQEQVTRRNYRDRRLQEHGWTVLHFSGSEFHRDPEAVIDAIQRAARTLRDRRA